VKVAVMASELEQWERTGGVAVDEYPRLGRMLLAYQLPSLILAALLVPVPLALVFVLPVVVLLLIAGLVGYGLERAHARAGAGPAMGRTLVRHQLCAGLLLQGYIVVSAYFLATVRLFAPGSGVFRADDFLIALAIGEGLYLVCVVLPLWLVIARRAHRAHRRRRPA